MAATKKRSNGSSKSKGSKKTRATKKATKKATTVGGVTITAIESTFHAGAHIVYLSKGGEKAYCLVNLKAKRFIGAWVEGPGLTDPAYRTPLVGSKYGWLLKAKDGLGGTWRKPSF